MEPMAEVGGDFLQEGVGSVTDPSSQPRRCYLCGSGRLELRFRERRLGSVSGSERFRCTSFGHGAHAPIWTCRSCGLSFQWPAPSEAELLEEYRLVEDPLYEAERQSRYLTFRKVLRALGPGEGRSLLDVGAYCGYFLDVARERGFRPEGLELSEWAAERARALGFEVHTRRLAELAASGRRYDVVTMWDVLEHMADPRSELESVLQLLTPGGTLYLSTIDSGSLVARVLGPRWPWLMHMHLFYFDRSTVRRLLLAAGFDQVSVGNYTHYVSVQYLLTKSEAIAPRLARLTRRAAPLTPQRWWVPVNLGDNMLVRAVRPA
jgi:2-polyprenyl-3-methyl-5-hydroxy-6-metoxy-1,4-benzoquinol methylase